MPHSKRTILFVDDDKDVRKTAELLLTKEGYNFLGVASPAEALSLLVTEAVDVVLLDLNFSEGMTSGEEGLRCLRDMLRHDPNTIVIVVTGYSGLAIAVQAIKAGASDFIMKPWKHERLVHAIESALTSRKSRQPIEADPSIMICESESMTRIAAAIDRFAPLLIPVLLTGGRGTGKTLAATTFHRQSRRATLNVIEAGSLIPSQLDDLPNRTLLLENIDRLDEAHVPDLLAWLHRAPKINSRLITTSRKASADIVLDSGLVYAVSTLDIEIPALKDRVEDVLPLTAHFIRVTCQVHGFPDKGLSKDAQTYLATQSWSDNVHELRRVVERAVVMAEGQMITEQDFVNQHTRTQNLEPAKRKLAASEKGIIEEALRQHNFNVSTAADDLGLSRSALYRRMAKYGL